MSGNRAFARREQCNGIKIMSKVWFVTGAGSGIGAGTVKAALRAGDRVIATGRNLHKLRRALGDGTDENLAFVQLDVADETQAKAAVEQAVQRFGRIDVLVNNAGYSLLGNFEELTIADFERQFATNFWGVAHVMRAALPVMRRQRSGHIINISSVAGVVGQKHCTAYGATKFAVEGLSLATAQEVGKRHEDTLAQRRPAGSYAPRPNRFGIQNWRMASTTVGMSRHASRSKDGVLRPRHCESRTGRPAGSTQWNKIGSSSWCSMAFGFSTRDHASSRSFMTA